MRGDEGQRDSTGVMYTQAGCVTSGKKGCTCGLPPRDAERLPRADCGTAEGHRPERSRDERAAIGLARGGRRATAGRVGGISGGSHLGVEVGSGGVGGGMGRGRG